MLDQSVTVCGTIEEMTIEHTKRIPCGFILNQASISPNLRWAGSRIECGQKKILDNSGLIYVIISFCGATRACKASFSTFLDYKQIQSKGRTPLTELSAGGKVRYIHNTKRTKEEKIRALSGVRNHSLSNQAAEDSRIRPHDHLDRH